PDREADRLRDPLRGPRPPATRWPPERQRPRARHPLRPGGRQPRPPEAVRHHGRPLGHQHHRNHPRRRRLGNKNARPLVLQRARPVLPLRRNRSMAYMSTKPRKPLTRSSREFSGRLLTSLRRSLLLVLSPVTTSDDD